ncbi:MAG TPA: M23 family metallopeptidase, partial [Beijerinckiaceae bacterium]
RERGASIAPRLFDDARMPAAARVAAVSASVSEVETAQIRTVTAIGEAAQVQTARLTRALADAGLAAERFIGAAESKTRGVGGPFVPFKLDPKGSPFEREVLRLQEQVRIADRLRDAVRRAPLRRPLPEGAETTSSFGSRVDPFLGRLAYHTGLDFRGEHGSPIRATGDGVVTHAGRHGGYGLMVEIDHGDGLTTRYAHLSAVLVEEGQRLASGAVVGRLGSTGRSTGPHLHYEVRIDDEAVDPMRFLRAGARHAALP